MRVLLSGQPAAVFAHVETGRWSFYFWQVIVFLLGFGALETIVVYPLALLAYCLLMARPHAWKALPLLVPSALYTGVHLWMIPRATSGLYAIHLDWRIFHSLWSYWTWALGAPSWASVYRPPWLLGSTFVYVLTGILMGLLAWAVAGSAPSRQRVAASLFGLAWFVLTIAPVLPLRDHQLDYYLTIPAIGLALAATSLLRLAPRPVAAVWLLIYVSCSVGFIERQMESMYRRSREGQRLIEAVRQARTLHPDKTILLDGVSKSLFYNVIYHQGFLTVGIRDVYLAPTNYTINTERGMQPSDVYELPARATLAALEQRRAVVYNVLDGRLREITSVYTLSAPYRLKPVAPRRVDVGEPLLASQLGPGWYQIQGSHRWMGRRAEVRLAAPRSAGGRLRLEAIYPNELDIGSFHLKVSANGLPLGTVEIRDKHSEQHVLALPASVVGLEEMTITLEVDRTFRAPNDPRDLGLAFGVLELITEQE